MSNFILSPNMNLPVPVVGQQTGPQYAENIDTCFAQIDQHDHSSGQGVKITPDGININETLPFVGNPATQLSYLNFSLGSAPSLNNSIYVSASGDLFYQNSSGFDVQVTLGNNVNATSSGISSGTNSASFVSNVLVVTQSVGVGAAIDGASYILRYNGSYPSPSGNAIVLAAPSSLSGTYRITFPGTTPVTTNALLTESTAGVLSYTNADNVTTQISAGVLSVKNGYITYEFKFNGQYGGVATPTDYLDGFCFFNFDSTLVNVWAYSVVPGSSGTTTMDIELIASPGGSGTTIFSTKPAFASTSGSNAYVDANGVVAPGTGVTAPVLSTVNVSAGNAMRFVLTGAMADTAANCGIVIQFKQR